MKKDYPQPAQSQKIPFWRRRWFWGVALTIICLPIAIIILIFLKMEHNILFILPRGFTETIYAFFLMPAKIHNLLPDYFKYKPTIKDVIYQYIFAFIYYLFLIILLRKAFQKPQVKIKYIIIVLLTLLISFFGSFMFFVMAS